MTNSEMENEQVEVNEFCYEYLEAASLEDVKCTTLRVRSLGSATKSEVIRLCGRNYQTTTGKTMQKLTRTCKLIACTIDTVYYYFQNALHH